MIMEILVSKLKTEVDKNNIYLMVTLVTKTMTMKQRRNDDNGDGVRYA